MTHNGEHMCGRIDAVMEYPSGASDLAAGGFLGQVVIRGPSRWESESTSAVVDGSTVVLSFSAPKGLHFIVFPKSCFHTIIKADKA